MKTLYDILTDKSLTRKQMAEQAVHEIDKNRDELVMARAMYEMTRDAKAECPYPEVQYTVCHYASQIVSACCSRIHALYF